MKYYYIVWIVTEKLQKVCVEYNSLKLAKIGMKALKEDYKNNPYDSIMKSKIYKGVKVA